jgi:hypothetical protein
VFKIYLRVFKILFKGVQHLYDTYINFFFSFVFNCTPSSVCGAAPGYNIMFNIVLTL